MQHRRARLRRAWLGRVPAAIVAVAATVLTAAGPATAGTATAGTATAGTATAGPACTVHGTLPARVSIARLHTAVPTVLTPSAAGCRTSGREDSAAYLYRGAEPVDVAVWSYFGETFAFDFDARVSRPGRYSLRDGIVLLEDPVTGDWIDFTWADTATAVKLAGRVVAVGAARAGGVTTIRATVQAYRPSVDAFRPLAGVGVHVERAHRGRNDWIDLGRRTSDSAGRVSLAYRTAGQWDFRVRLVEQPTVWAASSGRVSR